MKSPFTQKKRQNKILKYFFLTGLAVFAIVFLFIGSIYIGFFGKIPTKSGISEISHGEASAIFDVNEKHIGNFFRHYRSPVTYEQLPEHLVEALISTEDARFYEHNGVDYRSLARVFIKTILLGDASAGGGSTIPQQLAKNLYPREQDDVFYLIVAKIKEAIIARRIEKVYSKQEIITLYLNTVPFPDNVYGIQPASRTFFGKSVSDLSLEEAATLIGSLKATYTYNPRLFPERSRSRRNVVISQMVKYGNLHEDTAEVAMERPVRLNFTPYRHNAGPATYFREQIRKELHAWVKEHPKKDGTLYDIYNDGLKVYTTLDAGIQELADSAVQIHMASLQDSFEKNWGNSAPWITNSALVQHIISQSKPYRSLKNAGLTEQEIMDSLQMKKPMQLFTWQGDKHVRASTIDSLRHYLKFLQSGFVVLDPSSGAVRAWVGGIDFEYFQFDHVSQSRRQVGSTFKPIVYTAALEVGIDPCDRFSGRQVSYANMDGWTPSNGEEDYSDLNLSMQAALSHSVNTVSIKILEKTGLNAVIDQARDLNIQSDLPRVPSLALGTAELSMLELAGAYASFVNDRKPVQPYMISKITDRNGKVLAEFQPETFEPAYSRQTKEVMLELLQGVVNNGTASRLRWKYGLKNDIAGKTGTTQGNKDGWFIGVTPKLVAVSWVGTDHSGFGFKDTSVGQGSNSALPVFALFMKMLNQQSAYAHLTDVDFPAPSEKTLERLDCEPMKEDGFFKKLFTNSEEPEERDFKDRKRRLRWLRDLFRKD